MLSLPVILQLALQNHAASADINNDDELKSIMLSLSDLNDKVEAAKRKALKKRQALKKRKATNKGKS
jgi:hypothetical protein